MDNDFGYLLRCEVQTDTARLEPLTWAQGTTPRIIAAPTRSGLIVPADPGAVARMMIAESPTATLWAVVESTDRTENGYILQWPTVGTHTPPGKPWFYTIFFMRDGKRFWTGSGQLTIEETTATGDGLAWQEVATWEDMVGEVVDAVQSANLSSLTLNGDTITQWPQGGGVDPSEVVGIVENANLTKLKLNGDEITEWPQGGGAGAEQGRIVTDAAYTVAAGDTLIIMDSVTAGANQTLTLPNLDADFASITVRQLGDAHYTTIAHGQSSITLSGDGSWVCIDWVKSKSAWYWRN